MANPRAKRRPGELSVREAASWVGVSGESIRRAHKAGRVEGSFRDGLLWVTRVSVQAAWPSATGTSAPPRLRLVRGGPRTASGKARSSRNSLQHGLFAKEAVIREGKLAEDEMAFQTLLDDVCAALSPLTAYERAKVEQIAVLEWRRRRLLQAERVEFQNSEWVFLYGRRAVFDAHEGHLGATMRRLLDELAAIRCISG